MTKILLHQKANEMVDIIKNSIYHFIKGYSGDKDEYPVGLVIKTEQDKIELNEIKINTSSFKEIREGVTKYSETTYPLEKNQ